MTSDSATDKAKPETPWTRGVATRKANAERRAAEWKLIEARYQAETQERAFYQQMRDDPKASYIIESARHIQESLKLWDMAVDPAVFSPEAQRFLGQRLDRLISSFLLLRDRLSKAEEDTK